MNRWVYMAVWFCVLLLLAGCGTGSPAIPSPSPQPTPHRRKVDHTDTFIISEERMLRKLPVLLMSKEDLDVFHEHHLTSGFTLYPSTEFYTYPLLAHRLFKYSDDFFADNALIILSGATLPGCTVEVDSVWFDDGAIELSVHTMSSLGTFDADLRPKPSVPEYYNRESKFDKFSYHIFVEIPRADLSPQSAIAVTERVSWNFRAWELRTASSGAFPIDYNLRLVLNRSRKANGEAAVVSSLESLDEYIDNYLLAFDFPFRYKDPHYTEQKYSSYDTAGLSTAIYTDEFFKSHRLILFSYMLDYKESIVVDRVEAGGEAIEIYTKKLSIPKAGRHQYLDHINYFFILEVRAKDIEGKAIRVHQQ